MGSEPVPESVRRIHAVVDWVRRRPRTTMFGLVACLTALWLLQGIYTVDNAETAALQRFGRLVNVGIGPGLHAGLPGGIDRVTRVRTAEIRLEIQSDLKGALNLVTADENLIDLGLVVQYRVSRLDEFLFATSDPEDLVRQTVRAALVRFAATTAVDDMLTSAKARIRNEVREDAQDMLDDYGAGVSLVAINIQTVTPPADAASAFREVSDARAEASEMVSRADAEKNRSLSLARGEAAQMYQEAQAFSEVRTQNARGAASRFLSLLKQKRHDPDRTLNEIYLSVVDEVLPEARLVVLPPGELPRIDVNLYRPPGLAAPVTPPAGGSTGDPGS